MARVVVGVLAGLVAWFAVATLGNFVLRAALPGYAEVEKAMNFTLGMMIARLLLGALASLCAGFVVAWIARRGAPVVALVAVLLALFVPVHYAMWTTFPFWYHLVFLTSIVLLTWSGAAALRRSAQ